VGLPPQATLPLSLKLQRTYRSACDGHPAINKPVFNWIGMNKETKIRWFFFFKNGFLYYLVNEILVL
jgi:hypothetical protein